MSSSEVQTDVSDPLGKLVDRLDGLSTKEEREGDEEKKDVPKAARVTRCFPDIGALKETCEKHQCCVGTALRSGVLKLFRQ